MEASKQVSAIIKSSIKGDKILDFGVQQVIFTIALKE